MKQIGHFKWTSTLLCKNECTWEWLYFSCVSQKQSWELEWQLSNCVFVLCPVLLQKCMLFIFQFLEISSSSSSSLLLHAILNLPICRSLSHSHRSLSSQLQLPAKICQQHRRPYLIQTTEQYFFSFTIRISIVTKKEFPLFSPERLNPNETEWKVMAGS